MRLKLDNIGIIKEELMKNMGSWIIIRHKAVAKL